MGTKINIWSVIAVTSALLSGPAAAVEQTPAGAMDFLKMVLGGGSVKVLLDYGVGYGNFTHQDFDRAWNSKTHVYDGQYTPVQSVHSRGECKLVVNYSISTLPDDDHSQRMPYDREHDIDFSRLSKVEAGPKSIEISGSGTPAFILVPDGMGPRVAFAMEFLRLHCDRTSRTGF